MTDTPSVEELADRLLVAAYEKSPLDVFETVPAAGPSVLSDLKSAADQLVRARFARFADDGRTQIKITNAGRYWALNGGFMGDLKEQPDLLGPGGGGRQRNPEMEALRSEYMRLRLNTI